MGPTAPHMTGPNDVPTGGLHVMGPNCYSMTAGGYKLVGPAEACGHRGHNSRQGYYFKIYGLFSIELLFCFRLNLHQEII